MGRDSEHFSIRPCYLSGEPTIKGADGGSTLIHPCPLLPTVLHFDCGMFLFWESHQEVLRVYS